MFDLSLDGDSLSRAGVLAIAEQVGHDHLVRAQALPRSLITKGSEQAMNQDHGRHQANRSGPHAARGVTRQVNLLRTHARDSQPPACLSTPCLLRFDSPS
jgi:hypothetical protein